jgi:hypothetical protein
MLKKTTLELIKSRDMELGDFMQVFQKENVRTHEIGSVIQELTDEGQIIQESLGKRVIYHHVSSIEEKIRTRTELKLRNFFDKFRRSEWAEVAYSPPVTADYDKNFFSVYLSRFSFQRRGWKEEEYVDWQLLRTSWTRKDKRISLALYLTNNDSDHLELSGVFRRAKGETIAVPVAKQEKYVRRPFLAFQSIAERTQMLNSFATNIASIAKGRRKVTDNLTGYVSDLDIQPVPPAYRAVISPMIGYFEAHRKREEMGRRSYLARHQREHIPYIQHRISEIVLTGIPYQM